MMNKKGKWKWKYNAQLIGDEYKGIILSSYITQNPTDHFELIPSIEQLENNLTGIYDELPSNFQFTADNGYSTDENTTYLEEKCLDKYMSARKLSKKENKYNLWEKPSNKTISSTVEKLKHIFALWENFYIEEKHTNTKTKKNNLLDKRM